MIEEDKKLKPINAKPFTEVTPEMEAVMVTFAKGMLPVVDKLLSDIEKVSKEERKAE
jgi:hypothetical protein